jgi:Tol biopolymer transport system component
MVHRDVRPWRSTASRLAAIPSLVLTLALIASAQAPPAIAAFPGANGRIFFDTNRFGLRPTQIFSVRPDGSGFQQLTELAGSRYATQPSVSADGRWVLYVVSRDGAFDQIWMMRRDGSHAHAVTQGPNWAHDNPAFTPDGQRIVYARCGFYVQGYFTCKIVSMRLDGGGRRVIVGGLWHPQDIAISPDGSTIAYVSDKGGYDSQLWLVDADGSAPRMIVPAFKVLERPSWSPDGSTIAFGGLKNALKLYTVNADGTDLDVIARGSTMPSWSPDGQWIAFFSEADAGLEQAHPDGSDAQPVLDPADNPGAGDSDWGVKPA